MNQLEMDHSEMVGALAKPGGEIVAGLLPRSAHLLHMAVGICGEGGELIDAIKRNAIYGKELDTLNVIEELGDLEFYMEGLRRGLGITREETLQANIQKLGARYPTGSYRNEDAIARADKVGA